MFPTNVAAGAELEETGLVKSVGSPASNGASPRS